MTLHIFCVPVNYVLPYKMEYLYFLPKTSQLKKKKKQQKTPSESFVFLPKTTGHNYLCLTTSSLGRS